MDILYHNCKYNGKKTKIIPLISIIIYIRDGIIVSLVVYYEVPEGKKNKLRTNKTPIYV